MPPTKTLFASALVFVLAGGALNYDLPISDTAPSDPQAPPEVIGVGGREIGDARDNRVDWDGEEIQGLSDVPSSRRPAVIALLENGLPMINHPEFFVDAESRATAVKALGLPAAAKHANATTYESQAYYVNHFTAFNDSRILGVVPTGRYQETGESLELTLNSHGTATASRAVGASLGACPTCYLVYVNLEPTQALAWVFHQTWIDVVSVSFTTGVGLLEGETEAIQNLTRTGRPVFIANGNDPKPPNYDDGFYAAPSIAVGAALPDGTIPPNHTPGADIMGASIGAQVATLDGGTATGTGTSYAAPYLAGAWARFLSESWASGSLTRVVAADGTVQNHVQAGSGNIHPSVQDGEIEAEDALGVLAAFAAPATGFYAGTTIPTGPADLSYYSGYGVFLDTAVEPLASSLTRGFPPTPTMTSMHSANRDARSQAADMHLLSHRIACGVEGPECPYRYYLEHDNWFVF